MKQSKKSLGMKISAFVLSFAMVCTLLAGVNVVAFAADSDESLTDTVPVLRAYNPNNGEHLMTVDETEYNANVARGYSAEGEKWQAPLYSDTEVYRVYNPNSGEHLLLASKAEYDATVAAGWEGEGQKMYSDDNEGVPIYRVFNPNANDAGSHHYCDKEEAEGLVAIGWQWDLNGEPAMYGVAEEPPVVLVKLTDAEQLSANTLTVEFDQDATGLVDKDDIVVEATDGTLVLPINKIELAEDGLSATVSLATGFVDGKEYSVSLNDSEVTFTASVGDVATVVVETASAEQGVDTPIEFKLFDAQGVDVTSNVKINSTCSVDIQGAQGDTSSPSNSTILMDTVGATATVTVTYNSQEQGATDIIGVGTVTCVEAEAVMGTKMFYSPDVANADSLVNANSECGKFYWGFQDQLEKVEVDEDSDTIYFCAVDENGEAISYDTYSFSSSDEDVMSVDEITTTGKYASFTVHGNKAGSANVVVTATKYEKESVYTVPVTVTNKGTLSSIKYTFSKTTISNAIDADYMGTVTVKGYDSNGNEITDFDVAYEVQDFDTKAGQAKDVQENVNAGLIVANESGFGFDDGTGAVTSSAQGFEARYHAWNAQSASETIKITASKDDKVIERKPTVTVSAIDDAYWDNGTAGRKEMSVTYKVELSDSSIDIIGGALFDTEPMNVTSRLAAYSGTKFLGYVRPGDVNATWGVIGTAARTAGTSASTDSAIKITAKSVITNVKQAVKYGAKYTTTKGVMIPVQSGASIAVITVSGQVLCDSDININQTEVNNNLEKSMNIFAFEPVTGLGTGQSYMVVGDTSKDKYYAKPGSYTVRYAYTQDGKSTGVQTTLKVTNPVQSFGMVPKVTVTSRNVASIDEASIKENMKASVDMNNNTSANVSISNLVGSWNATTKTFDTLDYSKNSVNVKYAVVGDNYNGYNIDFYVPIGQTFVVSE